MFRFAACDVLTLSVAFALAAPAFAQPPADPVTTVEGVEAVGAVPVPQVGRGAPVFTSEEVREKRARGRDETNHFQRERDALVACYMRPEDDGGFETMPNPERLEGYDKAIEAAARVSGAGTSADQYTREALQARIDAAAGKVTMAEVEAAELRRQEAVLRLMLAEQELDEARAIAIDIQELARDRLPIAAWSSALGAAAAKRAEGREDPFSLVPLQYRDLRLDNLQVAERVDARGSPTIVVSGAIINTRTRRIPVPPISVTAVDELGYALKSETAQARGNIEPGAAFAFGYEMKPSPNLSASVVVTFADPDSGVWLLPASADPVCMGDTSPELDPRRTGSNRNNVIRNNRSWITRG